VRKPPWGRSPASAGGAGKHPHPRRPAAAQAADGGDANDDRRRAAPPPSGAPAVDAAAADRCRLRGGDGGQAAARCHPPAAAPPPLLGRPMPTARRRRWSSSRALPPPRGGWRRVHAFPTRRRPREGPRPAPARGPVHRPPPGRARPAPTAAHRWHASLSPHPQRRPPPQGRCKSRGRRAGKGSRSPSPHCGDGTTAAQSPPKVPPSWRQRRPPRHASHPWTDVVGAPGGARRHLPHSRLGGCGGHHCSGSGGGRDTPPPRPPQSHRRCRATAHPEADTRPRPAAPTGRGSPGGCGHDLRCRARLEGRSPRPPPPPLRPSLRPPPCAVASTPGPRGASFAPPSATPPIAGSVWAVCAPYRPPTAAAWGVRRSAKPGHGVPRRGNPPYTPRQRRQRRQRLQTRRPTRTPPPPGEHASTRHVVSRSAPPGPAWGEGAAPCRPRLVEQLGGHVARHRRRWAVPDVHDRHAKGVTARAQGKTGDTVRVANLSLTQALSPKRSQAQTMPTQADHSASFHPDETKR